MSPLDGTARRALRPEQPRQVRDEIQFQELVAAEALGNATPDQAAWLRQPGNLDTWREILVDLIRRMHEEQTGRRADVLRTKRHGTQAAYESALVTHADWSRRSMSFLRCVQGRLVEVKQLQRARNEAESASYRSDLRSRVETLEGEVSALRAVVGDLQMVAVEEPVA